MTSSKDRKRLSPEALNRLCAIVGDAHAISEPDAQSPYLSEWRGLYTGRTPLVLRPGSTAEVAEILAFANAEEIGIVTQGGNTGLVGGQIPSADNCEIVLSTARLNQVREIDPAGLSLCVEAGVTLANAQAAAADAGRLFPLSLASEGSATIGGNLATNAGGTAVLAYGTARSLALGLEVVLANGEVWHGLSSLKKDNTGYDLRDLFIGSEGTLGIITAARLKLFPKPHSRAAALAAVERIDQLLEFFQFAETSAFGTERLTAFEFMSARVLSFVSQHFPNQKLPTGLDTPWTVLIELSGDDAVSHHLESLLAEASSRGLIRDAVIASSEKQLDGLWQIRDACSEAQKHEGGSIKHDVSVPIGLIPEFLDRAAAAVESFCPGARPCPFGHFGDGNVHYNVSQPVDMETARYLDLWDDMNRVVHAIVLDLGGSISAEHGIGRLKRDELARVKSKVEMDVMRAIKLALDPKGILNPNKVV